MAGKIIIDVEKCKGCGLCVSFCPRGSIVIGRKSNMKGYFTAEWDGSECTGCGICGIVCPDAAIEVYIQEEVKAVGTKGAGGKSGSRKVAGGPNAAKG